MRKEEEMVAVMLASFADVRKARQCVHDLAEAAGIDDPGAAVLVTGELGNNCVEHGSPAHQLLGGEVLTSPVSIRQHGRLRRNPPAAVLWKFA
jgi:hypothetical protein